MDDHTPVKQRRYAKACDVCHGKKIKCDFDGLTCQLCRKNGRPCVFTKIEKTQRKRPKAGKRNDLSALEERLNDMEARLRRSNGATSDIFNPQAIYASAWSPSETNSPVCLSTPSVGSSNGGSQELPAKEVASGLFATYLATCNAMFPIFDPAVLQQRVQQDWPPSRNDIVWHSTALVVLGFANRLRAMYDPSDAQSHNLQASVYLSEALDISTKLSYSKPTLETAQILLGLVSLLRSTAMPRPARMFVSVAVRILQDLGAHMEPSNGNKSSPQIEDLGRVFWIAYIHDKAIATHTGTPPILYEQDITRVPRLYDSGWWTVKSLDNTTAANFFALRQRLATIQGLIYTKIQSLTASKNQCDLARAQAELNPQLTAWKQEIPFRFTQDELVGRWPWHAILFMILFACEYFDALLQLNREMDSDRVKFLAHDCPAANSLRSQIFSRSPLVLIAAREALDLALLVTNGNFANLWVFFDYLPEAITTLLVGMLANPNHSDVHMDSQRIETWIPIVDALTSASERPDLLEKRDFLLNLKAWALATAEAARKSVAEEQLAGPDPLHEGLIRDARTTLDDESLHADSFPFEQWEWSLEDESVLPIWRW